MSSDQTKDDANPGYSTVYHSPSQTSWLIGFEKLPDSDDLYRLARSAVCTRVGALDVSMTVAKYMSQREDCEFKDLKLVIKDRFIGVCGTPIVDNPKCVQLDF